MTNIRVQTLKYDGTPHRSWAAEIIEQRGDLLVLLGVFDREITHPDLGVIKKGTISYEYYWLERWYNVFRFHEPDGTFRYYYCNVNMPPKLDDGVLTYVDLDIDILVSGENVRMLDEQEFAENSARYGYPPDVVENVRHATDELLEMIAQKTFPFSEK